MFKVSDYLSAYFHHIWDAALGLRWPLWTAGFRERVTQPKLTIPLSLIALAIFLALSRMYFGFVYLHVSNIFSNASEIADAEWEPVKS